MENAGVIGPESLKKDNPIERKRRKVTVFGYEVCYFGVAMIIFSFFGFCAENIGRMTVQHVFDCRHQLLPFLFAYGIALLAIYCCLGKILSHIVYFLVIFAFIMAGEIAVGMLYEKFAGVILWDYSQIPTHITRYTSIITTLLYGGGVYLIMAFAFKPMMKLISKMGRKAAIIIDSTLGTAIIIDFIVMLVIMFVTGAAPEYWSVSW